MIVAMSWTSIGTWPVSRRMIFIVRLLSLLRSRLSCVCAKTFGFKIVNIGRHSIIDPLRTAGTLVMVSRHHQAILQSQSRSFPMDISSLQSRIHSRGGFPTPKHVGRLLCPPVSNRLRTGRRVHLQGLGLVSFSYRESRTRRCGSGNSLMVL